MVQAQDTIIVNSTNINHLEKGHYISIGFIQSIKSLKFTVDYGQKRSIFKREIAKDTHGSPIKIYSKIHAFNILADNGWVYIDNYEYVLGSSSEEPTTYLFKKTN